jgi:Leucine Rich repeat
LFPSKTKGGEEEGRKANGSMKGAKKGSSATSCSSSIILLRLSLEPFSFWLRVPEVSRSCVFVLIHKWRNFFLHFSPKRVVRIVFHKTKVHKGRSATGDLAMPFFGKKKKKKKDKPPRTWREKVQRALMKGGLLSLTDEFLGDAEVAEIAQMLRESAGNEVKYLHVDMNDVGDAGAVAVAELLRGNPPLETVLLGCNKIGADGIAALADALCENTHVKELILWANRGVDAERPGSSDEEAAAGVESLVAAIAVNTTLERVAVGGKNPHQKAVDAALADSHRGDQYDPGQLTKSAGKTE